ncbi:uncharacterized protein Z518_11333 [Rhinocladiella mackenziei CBS 650.93]|uniref:Uncharacterized protein n=1 Tax=Rhinocladiella mackenziei CBS 650.93 TaxID=1442369 RepID=A0A0D2I7X6_9EURO|nr:uncharacterized protein Z518_11333 [Rhinocladiella mackenziei CBS 650.93]KIW99345.1 hypothetical protein Z518_11333 [Rhinocladiella mackenziei CBS 650.93]
MKSISTYTTLSISSLLLLAHAWPLIPGSIERREPASYSVVAVDGGNTGGGGTASATTVTDAVTHTATVMKTQLSTMVVTESEVPDTIVLTVTSPSPTTITDYLPPSVTTQVVTAIPESSAQPNRQPPQLSRSPPVITSHASPSSYSVPSFWNFTPSPVTVTVTQALPSSRPYDDGMWHTYYYHTVSSEIESSSTTISEWSASAPSTTAIPEFWGGPNSGRLPVPTSDVSTGTPTEALGFWSGPKEVASSTVL